MAKSSAKSFPVSPECAFTLVHCTETNLRLAILIICSIIAAFGDLDNCRIFLGVNFLIPSIEAYESVSILTHWMEVGMASNAVQIAISSALVEEGHMVDAHPKEMLNWGMYQPEPIIGSLKSV